MLVTPANAGAHRPRVPIVRPKERAEASRAWIKFGKAGRGREDFVLVAHAERNGHKCTMESESDTVRSDVSKDGKKRWELVQRPDGFFTYCEDTFYVEDLTEFDGPIMEYWSPTYFSGLFNNATEAQKDALGRLPWLKAVLTAK